MALYGFPIEHLGAIVTNSVVTDSLTSSGPTTLDGDLAVGKSNDTFSITAANGVSGSGEDGCDVAITAGDGDTTGGLGGAVSLTGGAAFAASDRGGGITLTCGDSALGQGGDLLMSGGSTGASSTGRGGNIEF